MHALSRWDSSIEALAHVLRERGLQFVTAESCTGGLLAAACTSIAGSSDWFERGIVSYSNEAKTELLGVSAGLIAKHGAVSAEVARAMAEGALAHSPADLSLAVTGVAGPSGGTQAKPVGTVWLALARRGEPAQTTLLQLEGDRAEVREQTVDRALQMALAALRS